MTIYKLINEDRGTMMVRAADEDAARLMCVDQDREISWVDDDTTTCKMIMTAGRKEVLCVASK